MFVCLCWDLMVLICSFATDISQLVWDQVRLVCSFATNISHFLRLTSAALLLTCWNLMVYGGFLVFRGVSISIADLLSRSGVKKFHFERGEGVEFSVFRGGSLSCQWNFLTSDSWPTEKVCYREALASKNQKPSPVIGIR